MDPVEYYTTTLTTAFKTLAPLVAFLIGGYFIFIKLPFLFLKKSMNDQKRKLETEGEKKEGEERYTLEHYQEFQKKLRLMNSNKTEEKKESSGQRREKKQEKGQQKTKSYQQEERKSPPPSSKPKTPEEVFDLRPGEVPSEAELKRRYFELLKQNHPDRVASLGTDFKSLAEKNTKEINRAYEALKRKAS
jgi:hypothetical protein